MKPSDLERVYCLGDSHASFFSGQNKIQPGWPKRADDRLPCFRSLRLGPVLAYNLCKNGTRTHGRERLFTALETDVPAGGWVLLCFGEIDCRAHLFRQSQIQNKSVEAVTQECTQRYFSVVKELKQLGYQVMVWNAVASVKAELTGKYPTFGTCRQRNAITRLFNDGMAVLCRSEAIPFFSIFEQLVDAEGETRMEYYCGPEEVHLSQVAMPLALGEIGKVVPFVYPGITYEKGWKLNGLRGIHPDYFEKRKLLQIRISRG